MGTTVHQVPRATAAVEEVEAMTEEVLALLSLAPRKVEGKAA
jgi:chromosome partitioning protein